MFYLTGQGTAVKDAMKIGIPGRAESSRIAFEVNRLLGA